MDGLKKKHEIERLTPCLTTAEPEVRRSAAEALGKLGDPRAAGSLVAALQDSHKAVQRAAAEALRELGRVGPLPEAAAAALDDYDRRVNEQAAQRQQRKSEGLLADLKADDPAVRWSAVDKLARRGSIEPALAALGDEDPRVRRSAARSLGYRRDPRAVDALIAALNDEDWDVRDGAAQTLVAFGNVRAVAPLLAVIGKQDLPITWDRDLLHLLDHLPVDARPVELLIAALGNDHVQVRRLAARALAKFGDQRAVPTLTGVLDDSDPVVRRYAAVALGKKSPLTYLAVTDWAYERLTPAQHDRLRTEFIALIREIYPDSEFGYSSFRELANYDRSVLSSLFHELKETGEIESTGYMTFRARR